MIAVCGHCILKNRGEMEWSWMRRSRASALPPSLHCFLPLTFFLCCFLSPHSPHHPMVNSLPSSLPPFRADRRPSAFQLSFSPLSSDPSARRPPSLPPLAARESVCACVCGVGFFLISPPFLPSTSLRPASSERARATAPLPLTDQPANGQTVGRSLFRCHRGRPERAVQCVVCE